MQFSSRIRELTFTSAMAISLGVSAQWVKEPVGRAVASITSPASSVLMRELHSKYYTEYRMTGERALESFTYEEICIIDGWGDYEIDRLQARYDTGDVGVKSSLYEAVQAALRVKQRKEVLSAIFLKGSFRQLPCTQIEEGK